MSRPHCGASMMVRSCGGNIKAAVPAQLGAQGKVHIFAIGEKVFVEVSDIFKQTCPVKRSGSTRAEYRLRGIVLTDIQFPLSKSVSAAPKEDFVSCAVQVPWIRPPQEFGNGHAKRMIVRQCLNQPREAIGFQLNVVIQQKNEITARSRSDTAVECYCRATIA
jgi:hypothetical protein